MEEGTGADHLLLLGERHAAIADDLVESLDGFEVTADRRLVDECPQVLGWLQLVAVSSLEH